MAVSEKLTTLCLLASLFVSPAAAQDSANNPPTESAEISHSEKHLKEVVVTADRGWVEDGKIIFLPSKTEKNLSNSPASLIESMHLPMLKVKDNEIISLSGDKVVIYINGVKANENDLATFWPKLAKRVEYIENSPDAKYQGNQYVVNFIMTEYEAGGITRGSIDLATPSDGRLYLASKLVYKRMTFGATFSGNLSKDDNTETSSRESYKDLYHNGTHYDRITREYHQKNLLENRNLNAALNAKYVNGEFIATHTIALGFNKKPENKQWGSDKWEPDLFAGDYSYSNSKSKSFTPQISGNYEGKLAEKWFLWGGWSYAHSHNTNNSISRIGESDAITSGSKEEINALNFDLSGAFLATQKWRFQINTNGSVKWYDTRYSGYANQHSSMTRGDFSALFHIIWKPNDKISATLSPGINLSKWSTGELQETVTRPVFGSAFSWMASRKLSISWQTSLMNQAPMSAYTNPILTRQSEIIWMKGDPFLKNSLYFSTYLSANFLANKWLNISAYVQYSRYTDDMELDYISMPKEYGGILKTPFNAKPEDAVQSEIYFDFTLPGNALTFTLAPRYNYYKAHGKYADSLNAFSYYARAAYTLRNCRFKLIYFGHRDQMYSAGMQEFRHRDTCDFEFTYGNGNLYLSACVDDIFNTRTRHWTRFRSSNYDFVKYEYLTGRKFSISLTYTIGYGKKVDRSIDISGAQSVESSVLK